VRSVRERRSDDAVDELRTRRREERRLGPGRDRAAVQDELADALAERRPARLPRRHDVATFALEPLAEQLDLRRLAGAVEPFEGDEHARQDSDDLGRKKRPPVEHPVAVEALVRPWRTATLIASAVAAVELVIILVAGIALVGKPLTEKMRSVAVDRSLGAPSETTKRPSIGSSTPRLSRIETTVMVLNGNGVAGAAHEAASRVRARGYSIGEVGNANRTDFMRTVVMYRPGYRGEALRLARDLRIKIVGPLDGMRVRDLMGAHIALVVA
jgi:hypothetical protein